MARIRRTVTSLPGAQACTSASSLSVVGTTFACASAITRAMLRRTPLSCSGWPLTDAPGGWVRMGLPLAESVVRGGFATGAAATEVALRTGGAVAAPRAEPSAAACFTSCMVTAPSAPLACTRARSTPSFLAIARTAGMALTPPTAMVCSVCTSLETCMAPTTVPASSRSLSVFAGAAAGAAVSLGGPWWWPVSWPSARCGRLASGSNTASMLPVTTISPGAPASFTTLPEMGEGTSTTALAVSIDTSGSSRRITSPSLMNHSTMVASGRPSPRSGRWKVLLLLIWNISW